MIPAVHPEVIQADYLRRCLQQRIMVDLVHLRVDPCGERLSHSVLLILQSIPLQADVHWTQWALLSLIFFSDMLLRGVISQVNTDACCELIP